MSTKFFFELDNRVFAGVGCTRNIPELFTKQGYHSAVILVDEGVKQHNPYFSEILGLIEGAGHSVHIEVIRGTSEPDYVYLDATIDKLRALDRPDVLIGIGGGSTLDVAKACAAMLTHEGSAIKYRGDDELVNPPIDSIIIPTTAGTGSEATTSASFIDHKEMMKLGINGRYMNAKFSVLDAEWTASCPLPAAISAGIDAMVHTIESFMTTNANPMSRALNRESFRILHGALPSIVDDHDNAEKRQELLLGAYLAGAALFNTGSGIAGALSYPLSTYYNVPHGIGGGIFIADICKYNVERGYFDYADLLDAAEPHPDWSKEQKAHRFVELLQETADKLGVPKNLDQWNLGADKLDEIVSLMQPMQGAFDQNPIPYSAADDVRPMLMKYLA
jgi:alcohol dehydrogenase